MQLDEINRLKFRRQYILAPNEIECPFQHNCYKLDNNYLLYAHTDLLVTQHKRQNSSLILLGDIFDFKNPLKNNLDILKDMPDGDFNEFLYNTDRYMGRYVLIYYNESVFRLTHDSTACRKIFYAQIDENIWCASQPYLLALILNLKKTTNPEILKFYGSEEFKILSSSHIGYYTVYDDIRQLLPNYYLDGSNSKIIRFWPYKNIKNVELDVAVDVCSEMIKGFVEALANRYNLMIPVTAGKDSRLLVAASYNVRDKVFYYINKVNGLTEKSNDIAIPTQLFDILNLKFNVVDPFIEVEQDFKKIYYESNEFAPDDYCSIIYNYYKNFNDKVNLPGNLVASALEYYGSYKRIVNADSLAEMNYVVNYQFARNYFKEWLIKTKPLCLKYNIEILTMFYCEERLPNWGTQIHTVKDIAQEDIVPFNSRLLTQYFISVPPKYISRPKYILYMKIIEKLWPDLLKVPFNPSLKNKLIGLLSFLKIWGTIRKIQYYIRWLKIPNKSK